MLRGAEEGVDRRIAEVPDHGKRQDKGAHRMFCAQRHTNPRNEAPIEVPYADPCFDWQAAQTREAKMSWHMFAGATVNATIVGASLLAAVLLGLPFFLAVAALLTCIHSI
jgi:hypothetical protein